MSFMQVPYEAMGELGGKLNTVGERLADNRAADECAGLGDETQNVITEAIDNFRDIWKTSVSTLIEEVKSWSEVTTQIGAGVKEFDDGHAANLAGQTDETTPTRAGN